LNRTFSDCWRGEAGQGMSSARPAAALVGATLWGSVDANLGRGDGRRLM